jgi:hypothetical protein
MKNITYIFIISILFSCGREKPYPNKISDFRTELQIELNDLANDKNLLSRDPSARNYLKDNCSKEELLKLVKCEIPSLRVFAFTTIIIRNEKDYFKILLEHLSDTAKVYWSSRCMAGESMVSDLLIEEVNGKLTKNEKKILVDSVLLKHSYLDYSNYMIQEVEPNESYYPLIKERAKKKQKIICGIQLGACYALSKFKKKEDLEFLKNTFNSQKDYCGDWIFKSIEENPNKIYFPILEKYFYEIIKKQKQSSYDDLKYYCRAIAKYQNKESLALLTEILDKKNYPDTWYFKDNEDNVFRAIHKYKAPIYEDLYKKLKPKMSEFVMKYLDTDFDNRKTW